jgi:CRISPR-associated protein Cmr5
MTKTLEQKRAAFALAKVQAVNGEIAGEYATLAKRLPSMVIQCGVGQSLAFLLSKEREECKIMYSHLEEWLNGPIDEQHPRRIYNSTKLIEGLMHGSRQDYTAAQEEALSLLEWFSKFATAFLVQPKPSQGGSRP